MKTCERVGKSRLVFSLFQVAVLTGLVVGCKAVELGCSMGTQRVLSYDTELLPPTNISASSQDQSFNPDDYLFHRNNVPLRLWCTQAIGIPTDGESGEGFSGSLADFEQNNSDYRINVSFTRPIVVTQIISSGFSNGFVNNFSITYVSEEDNSLHMLLDEKNQVKDFIVLQIDTVFTLKHPFAAKAVHFHINDGLVTPSGRVCWHLALIGCTADQAVTVEDQEVSSQSTSTVIPLPSSTKICTPTTTTTTATTTVTTTAITTAVSTSISISTTTIYSTHVHTMVHTLLPSTTMVTSPLPLSNCTDTNLNDTALGSEGPPTEPTVIVKDYQILVIVIPAVAAFLLIMICIIAVGMFICVYSHGNSGRPDKDAFSSNMPNSSNTLRVIDNGTLYKSSSPLIPMSVLKDDKPNDGDSTSQFNGPLYENCLRNVAPSNKESGYYEPINLEEENSLNSQDSMVDNPTYSIPFPVSHRPMFNGSTLPPSQQEQQEQPRSPHYAETMNMVSNECYSTSMNDPDLDTSIVDSFTNRLPNDYETPL